MSTKVNLDNLLNKAESLMEASATVSTELKHLINQEVSTHAAMAGDSITIITTIFLLACFVGYHVIWRVTPSLHTPLMSVTNAISAIVIIGGIIATSAGSGGAGWYLGLIAIFLASINIFGGFIVTVRMLEMFKKRSKQ